MIYTDRVKVLISNAGEVDIVGVDGKTFIATLGYGEDAKEIAQHIVNLWNAAVA